MAIDQTAVVVALCSRTVTVVDNLCCALDQLEAIQEQLAGAEIDIADFSDAIEGTTGIGHCDAVTYKNILSIFAPQIVTALKAYYSGTPTQQGWAAFMKARR